MASCGVWGLNVIALFGVLAYESAQRRIETRMPNRRAIVWNENGPIRLCANVSIISSNWPTCPAPSPNGSSTSLADARTVQCHIYMRPDHGHVHARGYQRSSVLLC
jgi:hypothetical protein